VKKLEQAKKRTLKGNDLMICGDADPEEEEWEKREKKHRCVQQEKESQ
jgi:hypothetical protein